MKGRFFGDEQIEDEQINHMLQRLNISGAEARFLRETAKEIVDEGEKTAESKDEGEVDYLNIKKAQLYDRFVKNALTEFTEKLMSRSDPLINKPRQVGPTFMRMHEKIAVHMFQNNVTEIDRDTFNKIFTVNQDPINHYLSLSPLIEKNDQGVFTFKTGIANQLRDYFVAKHGYENEIKAHQNTHRGGPGSK